MHVLTRPGGEQGLQRCGKLAWLIPMALVGAGIGVARAGEVGIQWGAYHSYREVLVSYDSDSLWTREFGGRRLDIGFEASVGRVTAPSGTSHHELWHLGASPVLRYWLTPRTGIEYLLGGHLFSGVRLGDKNISTAFQFGDSIGLMHRFGTGPWALGVRVTHYSNADLKLPNPGQNYLQLRATYAFK